MKFLKSIPEYLKEISLPAAKYPHFYVGRHEDNMQFVKRVLPPVKHELYSISIFMNGDNSQIRLNQDPAKKVLIRSPFRVIEWDLSGDRHISGIVVIFSSEFIKENILWKNLLLDFPFFRHSAFFNEDFEQTFIDELYGYFNKIHECYYGNIPEKFELIKGWLQIILLLLKNEYNKRIAKDTRLGNTINNRLVADFEDLLIKTLENPDTDTDFRKASFYSSRLCVHVNHLNAVVKEATGKTTSQIVQEHLCQMASALLRQSDFPVKQISERFNFSATTHFIAFFKKHTGLTPKIYRESV
jgi:AraC family transcriptional regulator, transcriptional activator of pobA